MSISPFTGGTAANALQNNFRAAFKQKTEDFKALASAIQSGDLTGAQSAYDTVAKDIQNNPRIAKSGKNDQINKDLSTLGDAIKAGNADAAKQAFATLARDLKGLRHGGHKHEVENDGDADDGGSTPVPTANASANDGTSTLNALA